MVILQKPHSIPPIPLNVRLSLCHDISEYGNILSLTGNQTQCPASGLVPTGGDSKLLKKTTSTLEHTVQSGGHYYFAPRDSSKDKDTPVSNISSSTKPAVSTANPVNDGNSASKNWALRDENIAKITGMKVLTPALSPGYYSQQIVF